MDRNTNLRDMDAPGVGSGKDANESTLKGLATYPLANERGSNTLEEYTTSGVPKEGAGGKAKHGK
jgi:hypothetical protein